MPNRPSIPVHITRQILIESGHRCSVCGASCPLERAHIVPWHKSKEHRAEDLICLCASCHERADLEGWGEATLREYKKKPWILRQNNKLPKVPKTRKVQLTIDVEFEEFNEAYQRLLQYAIARFLDISPEAVKIISAEEANSVKVTIELPEYEAKKLIEAYEKQDISLAEHLSAFSPLALIELKASSKSKKKFRKSSRKVRSHPPTVGHYLTIREVSDILKVSVETVRRWVIAGILRGIKSSRGMWYVQERDVARLIEVWGKEDKSTAESD